MYIYIYINNNNHHSSNNTGNNSNTTSNLVMNKQTGIIIIIVIPSLQISEAAYVPEGLQISEFDSQGFPNTRL